MDHKGYFPLGYITKTRGLKGEVQLYFQVDEPEHYYKLESVFLEINQKLVPFFISKISIQKSVAYIFFEDIDHIDKASPLLKKTLFVSEKLRPKAKKELTLDRVQGFCIIDQELGEIGVINEILKMPQQLLASLTYQGHEVLIPLTEALITGINVARKEIEMSLPEGLIDLYLE